MFTILAFKYGIWRYIGVSYVSIAISPLTNDQTSQPADYPLSGSNNCFCYYGIMSCLFGKLKTTTIWYSVREQKLYSQYFPASYMLYSCRIVNSINSAYLHMCKIRYWKPNSSLILYKMNATWYIPSLNKFVFYKGGNQTLMVTGEPANLT